MRYRRWVPAALAIPALLLAACGGGSVYGSSGSASMSAAPASSKASGQGSSGMKASAPMKILLKKAETGIGAVLVDAQGYTLYRYDKDTPTRSACTGSCATAWPPLLGVPYGAAAQGFLGKFGTISRAGGMVQAT